MLEINKIYLGDCLEVMKEIDTGSIDLIVCDPPYQITKCSWDTIIPFEPLWVQYKRILKENGAVILFAQQPFTSKLVMSNLSWFKYSLVYQKSTAANFFQAKIQPLRNHEDILMFYKKTPTYNPQGINKCNKEVRSCNRINDEHGYTREKKLEKYIMTTTNYPKSILKFNNKNQKDKIHPTEKPVLLYEYLIKTWSNENELILDNCSGSGVNAIACMNTNRNFIGIEMNEKYYDASLERIEKHKSKQGMIEEVKTLKKRIKTIKGQLELF